MDCIAMGITQIIGFCIVFGREGLKYLSSLVGSSKYCMYGNVDDDMYVCVAVGYICMQGNSEAQIQII